MAKKKTTKKSSVSVVGLVCSGLTMLLGVMMIVMMALPNAVTYALGKATDATVTGFDFLNFDGETYVAVIALMLVIFASLLIFFAILRLIVSLNIVKSEAFVKFVNIAMLVSAVLAMLFAVAHIITISTYCGETQLIVSDKIVSGLVPATTNLIINAGIGFVSILTGAVAAKK